MPFPLPSRGISLPRISEFQCCNCQYYCNYHYNRHIEGSACQDDCLCHSHCRWSIVNWLPLPQLVKAFRASTRIPSEKSENATCTQSYWFPFFLCQFVICCNQSYGSPFFLAICISCTQSHCFYVNLQFVVFGTKSHLWFVNCNLSFFAFNFPVVICSLQFDYLVHPTI